MADEKQKKHFIKDMKQELKRVIWPTTKQTAKNTLAVIVLVILVSVIVLIFDFTFRKGNDFVVDKVTSGKVTQYREEIVKKQEILTELAKYVDESTMATYNQIAYYMDVASLEQILENAKNPKAEEETEQTGEQTENSETEENKEND